MSSTLDKEIKTTEDSWKVKGLLFQGKNIAVPNIISENIHRCDIIWNKLVIFINIHTDVYKYINAITISR